MIRRTLGTALSATMALSGCSVVAPESPRWVDAPAAISAEDNAPKKPVVTIGNVAARHLSPAVAEKIDTVVRIDTYNSYASGVATKLGYLTSGHLLRNEHDKIVTDCGAITVIPPAVKGKKPGTIDAAELASVRREPDNPLEESFWRDIALINTGKAPKGDTATLDKKNKDMAIGEEVTLINFRPALTQPKDRGPNIPVYTERSPRSKAPYDTPAIFTGHVLSDPGGDDQQIAILLGHGASHGKIPEKVIAGGASGGAMINAGGTTKALTTGEIRNTLPISDIERIFGVDIQGEHASTGQVGFMQPLNQELIGKLGQGLEPYSAPACETN